MRTNMLKNERSHFMDRNELFQLLGLNPNHHLPTEGLEATIQGVKFRCDPAPAPALVKKNVRYWDKNEQMYRYRDELRPEKHSRHRVKYLCNCGKWIPFGRAQQHNTARVHQED